MGNASKEPGWHLPPAEPYVLKNFAGYLHGLQVLKAEADAFGDQMEDAASRKTTSMDALSFLKGLDRISDHLGELIFRMEDDNFFPVGPEHDPPLADAKQRALRYIIEHPGTPDHVITWALRCTDELTDRVMDDLLHEGKIHKKGEGFFA